MFKNTVEYCRNRLSNGIQILIYNLLSAVIAE